MRYQHTFIVKAPLAEVREFHAHPSSMAAITPPPVVAQLHAAPTLLQEGDRMDFTLWLGPLPIRWSAKIEDVSETSFADRQLQGPFETWLHRHTFVVIDETTTEVVDEINFSLKSNPFWKIVGWGMRANLPILFAYRAWKTRRLLEKLFTPSGKVNFSRK